MIYGGAKITVSASFMINATERSIHHKAARSDNGPLKLLVQNEALRERQRRRRLKA